MIGVVPVHCHRRYANCTGYSPDTHSGMAFLVEDGPRRAGNPFRSPAVSHVYTVYHKSVLRQGCQLDGTAVVGSDHVLGEVALDFGVLLFR